MQTNMYDEKGTPIERGDIVRIFHFIGRRRKKYYMYKQCLGVVKFTERGTPVVAFDHLTLGTDPVFHEYGTGERKKGYLVIQGAFDDYEDRPKQPPSNCSSHVS